jgi:DNA-binding transcriptional MerR regulator
LNVPRLYDQPAAAKRLGVTVRTLRRWQAWGILRPMPHSRDLFGRVVYSEQALVQADRLAARRKQHAQRNNAKIAGQP